MRFRRCFAVRISKDDRIALVDDVWIQVYAGEWFYSSSLRSQINEDSYERQSESGNGVFSGLFDSDTFLQAVKESIQDAVRNNEENVIAEMKQLIEEITVSSSVENTKKNNPSKERNDRDSFQLASSFLSEWNAE